MPRTHETPDVSVPMSPPKKVRSGNQSLGDITSPNCVASVAGLSLAPPEIDLRVGKDDKHHDKTAIHEGSGIHKKDHNTRIHSNHRHGSPKSRSNNGSSDSHDTASPTATSPNPVSPGHRHFKPADDVEVPHLCWWKQLEELEGDALIKRISEIKLDDMIDYHGGVLNARFVERIIGLYDHVVSQGDVPGSVYENKNENMLPYWCPAKDEAGFTRLERLGMAAEYDVWQWYLVTSDNYSLLDTLIWMGLQVKKLFSRPISPLDE